MTIDAFQLASRFIGLEEVDGKLANPAILAMLQLDDVWPTDDSVPWCSAFTNAIAWLLRLPRSKSLRARSWLSVGRPIDLEEAVAGFDVVIFNRGGDPSPDVIEAPGHVAWFGKLDGDLVSVLGGNQRNSVSLARFPRADVLGVRRLVG